MTSTHREAATTGTGPDSTVSFRQHPHRGELVTLERRKTTERTDVRELSYVTVN